MNAFSDCLSTSARWELAVRTLAPARLARTFASAIGCFYDRHEFDALACHARGLYARTDPARGETFSTRLDRQLRDRHHAPVAWDVSPIPSR